MSRQLAEDVYRLGDASREDALPGTQTGGAQSGAHPTQSLHPGFAANRSAEPDHTHYGVAGLSLTRSHDRLRPSLLTRYVLLRRRCARCVGGRGAAISSSVRQRAGLLGSRCPATGTGPALADAAAADLAAAASRVVYTLRFICVLLRRCVAQVSSTAFALHPSTASITKMPRLSACPIPSPPIPPIEDIPS